MGIIYALKYHQLVREDIKKIDTTVRKRIKKALETKLTSRPETFGIPLRKSLKGYRKLRVGDYRILFKIAKTTVYIIAIMYRSDIYQNAQKRT